LVADFFQQFVGFGVDGDADAGGAAAVGGAGAVFEEVDEGRVLFGVDAGDAAVAVVADLGVDDARFGELVDRVVLRRGGGGGMRRGRGGLGPQALVVVISSSSVSGRGPVC
jgi:hypothetical protein